MLTYQVSHQKAAVTSYTGLNDHRPSRGAWRKNFDGAGGFRRRSGPPTGDEAKIATNLRRTGFANLYTRVVECRYGFTEYLGYGEF